MASMKILRIMFALWFAAGAPAMAMAHALAGDCDHGAERITARHLERSTAVGPEPANEPCAGHARGHVRHGSTPGAEDHHAMATTIGAAAGVTSGLQPADPPPAEQGPTDCCGSEHCIGNLCGASLPSLLTSSFPSLRSAPTRSSQPHDHAYRPAPGHHLTPLRPPA